jgi:hypothetical protein
VGEAKSRFTKATEKLFTVLTSCGTFQGKLERKIRKLERKMISARKNPTKNKSGIVKLISE